MVEECFDLPLYEWNKVDTSDAVSSRPFPAVLILQTCPVDFCQREVV